MMGSLRSLKRCFRYTVWFIRLTIYIIRFWVIRICSTFDSRLATLISSKSDETSVQLKLYTKDNINMPFLINMSNIPDAPIDDVDCPIEVLVHGWEDNSETSWLIKMKNKLLESGCYYVIIIDWRQLASGYYYDVVSNVPSVGKYIGKVFVALAIMKGIKIENIRIRAFSLGAHVAGFIGKTIFSKTHTKVGRITGLDPAGLSFQNVSPDKRLDKDDATFTDIIHTSIKKYGTKVMGHADFYPNGGYIQPCSRFPYVFSMCCHGRAHQYFTYRLINLFPLSAIHIEILFEVNVKMEKKFLWDII